MRNRGWIAALGIVVTVALGLAAPAPLAAQAGTGRIVGKVLQANGEPLAGAIVDVEGVAVRTTSAIDGRYTLLAVPAGTVSVRFRMIGYKPKTVTGVVVKAGTVTVQDASLEAEILELQEITVTTTEAEKGSVDRALDEQRNAVGIINSISAEQIKQSPDGNAGEAVARVSGVTVQEGKYVIVRGLGERYTTTALNGARIPSTEPERRVTPLDLFPSDMLEGISTAKTFTPDQPGDFSGAQVNLKTREFPAGRVTTLSIKGGFNDAATFSDVVQAPRTGSEWLGFAGKERQIPADLEAAGSLAGLNQTQVNGLIGQLRNVWSQDAGTAAPNGSFGFSVGGEDPVFGRLLGYALSFTYANTQLVRRDETRGLAAGDTIAARPYNTYTGEGSARGVSWGGMANLSTRIGSGTKLAWNNTITRTADNDVSALTGDNEEFAQFNPLYVTRLTFTERQVISSQLTGEHLLSPKHLVDWRAGVALVDRNEPDRSDIAYTAQAGQGGVNGLVPWSWPGGPRFATRNFSELSEQAFDGSANYRLALGGAASSSFLRIGGLARVVSRDADSRAYDLINQGLAPGELQQRPEDLFGPANVNRSAFVMLANANGGRYTADEFIGAGYAMAELPLTRTLRLVGGARVEYWKLDVITTTPFGQQTPARPRNTDVLPSLSLTWGVRPDMNLRLSGTQTLSRPEYRELSPVPYFEQIGLLTTFGNPDLERALIQNGDLRWEWFPRSGEIVSVSAFYKHFSQPIEKIIVLQAGSTALSYVNADGATNYGAEIELRKRLDFIGGEALAPFTAFANTTLMKSDITPGNLGLSALTRTSRPMVGQSAYVVNAGLGYNSPDGRWAANVLYNVAGRRIQEAGAGGLPDSYEEARHLLDVAVILPVWQRAELKLEARNLLDAPYRLTQGDVTRQRWRYGRELGFGFTWQL